MPTRLDMHTRMGILSQKGMVMLDFQFFNKEPLQVAATPLYPLVLPILYSAVFRSLMHFAAVRVYAQALLDKEGELAHRRKVGWHSLTYSSIDEPHTSYSTRIQASLNTNHTLYVLHLVVPLGLLCFSMR
jgi:hypothetical protein